MSLPVNSRFSCVLANSPSAHVEVKVLRDDVEVGFLWGRLIYSDVTKGDRARLLGSTRPNPSCVRTARTCLVPEGKLTIDDFDVLTGKLMLVACIAPLVCLEGFGARVLCRTCAGM